MGVASWAIPVGVLAGIVVVGFAFVWWWFPRAWMKGNRNEAERVHELEGPEREAQRQKNREIIERFARARAMERGEIVQEQEPPKYSAEVRTGEIVR